MRASTLILSFFIVAICFCANAQWLEMTASWTAQGLSASGEFLTDPNTNTMYYLSGTNVKTYDPGTDTWTDLNPIVGAGVVGYSGPSGNADGAFFTAGGTAGRFIMSYQRPQLDVYDIGTNSWYKTDVPIAPIGWGWGQGNVYNPVTGEFWFYWTAPGETPPIAGAPYDPVTDTWGEAQDLSPWPGPAAFWGRMESVNIGTKNYSLADDNHVGRYVWLEISDLTDSEFPLISYTQTSIYDLGEGNNLAWGCHGTQAAFRTQILAAHGTDIYLTGVQESPFLLVYHTATDTWEQLAMRPNDDPSQACRSHSTAIAGDLLFVRDGNQFWLYSIAIPEPAVVIMALTGLLGFVARRKR